MSSFVVKIQTHLLTQQEAHYLINLASPLKSEQWLFLSWKMSVFMSKQYKMTNIGLGIDWVALNDRINMLKLTIRQTSMR